MTDHKVSGDPGSSGRGPASKGGVNLPLLAVGLLVLAAAVTLSTIYGKSPAKDNAALQNASLKASGAATGGLNAGEMAAFVFKKSPEEFTGSGFKDATDADRTLAQWRGKVVLLNLWATWCAPCRKEMPALDQLQKELGSDRFEVVAISVDKSGIEGARKFLDGIKVANLSVYADPTARLAANLKAIGMPTTLLIDAEGREVGRLAGPAEWNSDDAKRLIQATIKR